MYVLIGIIVVFTGLTAAVGLPSNGGFRNERPRGRPAPRNAGGAQDIIAEETALALDQIYLPGLR